MRLHTRHIPFDFIAPEERKSRNIVLVGLIYLAAVLSLVFVAQWAVAADLEPVNAAVSSQVRVSALPAGSDPAGLDNVTIARSSENALLPIALGSVASLLLMGAARRRAKELPF